MPELSRRTLFSGAALAAGAVALRPGVPAATYWHGYMDGAITFGGRAVAEVLGS